jgi:hypothetical protein
MQQPLNHKQLRRVVDRIWNSTMTIRDTDHPEKHSNLNVADALLSLLQPWSDLRHEWDHNRKTWRYVIHTIGMDGRRVTTVFVPCPDGIEIMTRFQDEYAKRYRTSHAQIQKK